MTNLGSVFVDRTQSGTKINLYYGYTDGTGSHAHVVLIEGRIEEWRDISGISPIIKSCGSIFL